MKDNDDYEIGNKHGKEYDVLAMFNNGRVIEKFDDMMRKKQIRQ